MYFPDFIRPFPIRLLICLGVLASLTACQPQAVDVPVHGQVFVVTSAGSNLRLGSVRVQFFDEEQIDAHVEKRERELVEHREALGQELKQLEELLARQNEEVAKAEAAYAQRDAEVRRELQAFNEEAENQVATLQSQIEANAAFIESKDVLPPAPEGVPTREEARKLDERRREWLSMSRAERLEWAENLGAVNLELEAEIEGLNATREQMLYAFGDELRDLDQATESAQQAVRETQDAIEAIAAEIERPLDTSDYLANLPEAFRTVRTDADGEFIIDLPTNRGYVLLAETERRLDGEDKNFTWFVRVGDMVGSRILLSNHNLVASDASENVIQLPAEPGESGS